MADYADEVEGVWHLGPPVMPAQEFYDLRETHDPTYELASTPRASGGVRRLFSTPENIDLSNYSIPFFESFAETMAVDGVPAEIEFHKNGYLFIVPPDHLPMLTTNYEVQLAHGCHVVLLDQAPNHHAAMFMVSVGNNTMLVGDPSLGRAFLPTSASVPFPELAGGPDFSKETQHLFDAVARQCADTGYRVVRIPTIPAADGRSYLTYVNCLIDRQGSRRFVYLPFYQNADALNAAARAIWEELGFEVRPVDCTSTYRQFGALHCLVNVLSRSTNDLAKRSAGN